MRGKVSFLGIFLGDFTPDFLSKFWVYGITINGHHYGASVPHQWHRGWPGMGFTHTLFLGRRLRRSRSGCGSATARFTVGYLLGYAAHALTDVNDSVGTMLLFPFTTLNWTLQTWAYAATIDGGKYLDAAAYYSSLGLVMDLFWLVVVLCSWRVLTREYWRTQIVPADARTWAVVRAVPARARPAGAVPGDVLLRRVPAVVVVDVGARVRPTGDRRRRATAATRSTCPGPGRGGSPARSLHHVNPWIVLPVTLALLALVYWAVEQAVGADGRAEAARRTRPTADRTAPAEAPTPRRRPRPRRRAPRPDRGRGSAGSATVRTSATRIGLVARGPSAARARCTARP